MVEKYYRIEVPMSELGTRTDEGEIIPFEPQDPSPGPAELVEIFTPMQPRLLNLLAAQGGSDLEFRDVVDDPQKVFEYTSAIERGVKSRFSSPREVASVLDARIPGTNILTFLDNYILAVSILFKDLAHYLVIPETAPTRTAMRNTVLQDRKRVEQRAKDLISLYQKYNNLLQEHRQNQAVIPNDLLIIVSGLREIFERMFSLPEISLLLQYSLSSIIPELSSLDVDFAPLRVLFVRGQKQFRIDSQFFSKFARYLKDTYPNKQFLRFASSAMRKIAQISETDPAIFMLKVKSILTKQDADLDSFLYGNIFLDLLDQFTKQNDQAF